MEFRLQLQSMFNQMVEGGPRQLHLPSISYFLDYMK